MNAPLHIPSFIQDAPAPPPSPARLKPLPYALRLALARAASTTTERWLAHVLAEAFTRVHTDRGPSARRRRRLHRV